MSNPPGEFTSLIPNSKKVITVLISKFPPAGKTIVAIFYEIGIIVRTYAMALIVVVISGK